MTTRRDFVKSAAAVVAGGVVGFPVRGRARTDTPSDSPTTDLLPSLGQTSSGVASNGYLSALLPGRIGSHCARSMSE
jgi:hypothetical protein